MTRTKAPSFGTYSSSNSSRFSTFRAVVDNLDLCDVSLGLAPCERSKCLPPSLSLYAFAGIVPEFVISRRTLNEASALRISGCGGSRYCLKLASRSVLTIIRGMMFVLSIGHGS